MRGRGETLSWPGRSSEPVPPRYAVQLNQDLLRCPCCGDPTLTTRDDFEICAVCRWQDDGQDDHDADEVRGGPNGDLSLTQARARVRATRPDDTAAVAPPSPSEDLP